MPRLSRAALTDGRTLVVVVVLGGLVTLQSSNNLDSAKAAYLILAIAATAAGLAAIPWWLSEGRSPIARPWVMAAGAMVALLMVSLAVSRAHGTQLTLWLRDAAPYGLFAVAPILALACARRASQRWLVAVLVLSGSLASFSFAVEWIDRRQLASIPIDRIVLPTGALASALLALATALAIAGIARRSWWAATAGVVLGLFFATGTRSTLLLLAVPIGAAAFAGRPRLLAVRVVVTELAIAIAVFYVAAMGIALSNGTLSIPRWPSTATSAPSTATSAPSTATLGTQVPPTTTPPPAGLGGRVDAVGSLLANPGGDQSLQERFSQTKVAWEAFVGSPLVGVGPGYGFRWTNSANVVVDTFSLDTPVVYLAKFGLVGLVPVGLFVAAAARLARELRRRRQQSRIEYLTVIGFAFVIGVASIQGSPVEDKGASFALILVVSLGLEGLLRRDHTEVPASESLIALPGTSRTGESPE